MKQIASWLAPFATGVAVASPGSIWVKAPAALLVLLMWSARSDIEYEAGFQQGQRSPK